MNDHEPKPLKGEFVPGAESIDGTQALTAITRVEIDSAIATAHQYPRPANIKVIQDKARVWALHDVETATSCFYVLKRKSADGTTKRIEGYSIRFAEIIADAMGNIDWGARVIAIGRKFIHAQGVARDLETNNRKTSEVARSIWGKNGRYGENLIMVTGNAACAIAGRNALLQVVPRVKFKCVYDEAKLMSVGDVKSLADQIDKGFKALNLQGASDEQILEALGRENKGQVVREDIIDMRGFFTAIKENGIIEEVLGIKIGGESVVSVVGDALDRGEAKPIDLPGATGPTEPPAGKKPKAAKKPNGKSEFFEEVKSRIARARESKDSTLVRIYLDQHTGDKSEWNKKQQAELRKAAGQ